MKTTKISIYIMLTKMCYCFCVSAVATADDVLGLEFVFAIILLLTRGDACLLY